MEKWKQASLFLIIQMAFFTGFILSQTAELPDHPWHFLDTRSVGAYQFIGDYPTCDGRAVLVVICDSGVDMGIPGLLKTSDGKNKVIDAQDFFFFFDITLSKAEIDSSDKEAALTSGNLRLTGFEKLEYHPEDSVFWLGAINEQKHFQNSSTKDINNNGKRDDLFGLVTFPVQFEGKEQWVYYLDEDGDGNLQDEKPRFDYKVRFDTFTLRGRNPKTKKALLTFVINIRADEKVASLHACDNSHGTHCAGISTGFEIFGEKSQHGIAPGAQVLSCKIGDATLAGGSSTTGSMKRAYEYGVKFAKGHNMPVVFSMSYGIGSEIEGHSDIETFLDNFLKKNEKAVVVVSNGNGGPGIASTGNPSGASRVISVGAMLPQGSAQDSYGFTNDGHRVFHFSSRGGDVPKPDFIAPGCASSTVPAHSRGENMWGTSMSCPQGAGAAAVLISACLQENVPFNGALIKRALKYSARPLPGYTPLDQGTGLIDLPRAFEIMKQFAQRNELKTVLVYKIKTFSPNRPDESGQTSYWRTGTYFPKSTEKQNFRVRVIFPKDLSADEKAGFYRAFNLESDQPWFKLDKKSTYIRGQNSARIGGYFLRDKMKKPGLYAAKISAFPKSGPGRKTPEFEILATVIIPYTFHDGNDYQLNLKNKTLKSGQNHRHFVLVPPGATALHVSLSPTPGKWCGIYGYVYDPEGIRQGTMAYIDPDKRETVSCSFVGEDLTPGIWEIIPFAYHDLTKTSTYDLQAAFDGFDVRPKVLRSITNENGELPEGSFEVVNLLKPFFGTASGSLQGYEKKQTILIFDDIYRHAFKVDDSIQKVYFKVRMDKETYNLFTDVAINIRDGSDKILWARGMGQRMEGFTFIPPNPGTYDLEIIGGFAYPSKKNDGYKIELTERYLTKESIDISVFKAGDDDIALYPGVSANLDFDLDQRPRMVPDGFQHWGEVEFKNEKDGKVAARIPILLE